MGTKKKKDEQHVSEFEYESPSVQLANERVILMTGEIDESPVGHVITHLFNLSRKNPKAPIYLVINTYGGSVDDMFALYDAMLFVKAPIRTVGLGKIMSAGLFLLAAGEG